MLSYIYNILNPKINEVEPMDPLPILLFYNVTENVKSLEMSLINDISAKQRSSSADLEPLVLLPIPLYL